MSVLPVGIGSEVGAGGYQIERSLRFNSADSAYLNRTPGSASNRKTYSFSCWVKRGTLSSNQNIVAQGTNEVLFRFNPSDYINFADYTGGAAVWELTSASVYRDCSAWYHIVFAVDTTQATSANRIKVWVNNVQVTFTGTYPSQNSDTPFNTTNAMLIGNRGGETQYFNGYLTEIKFIDGSALDPTSFGEFNEDTGVWQPKAYAGSYGTNGFYLNFSDNSGVTSTTLGADSSGNGNNWTPNNFSVTAGAGNDSLVDTPTNYGTDTGVGGEVRGNYATWNGVAIGADATLTNGNLDIAYGSATTRQATAATIGVSSGKWYWEVRLNASSITNSVLSIGIAKSATPNEIGTYVGEKATDYGYYGNDGTKFNNGSSTAYGASYAPGDVLGFALDMDAGTCVVYKNNTSQGTIASGLTGTYFPAISDATPTNTSSASANFGQRPFSYAAPTGFKALCTQNLPEPTIVDGGQYFNTVLWTGNGASTRSLTGVGFQPDFSWLKSRSEARNHTLYDAVRGAGSNKALSSSTTDPEGLGTTAGASASFGYVSTFDTDGFSVSAGSTNAAYVNVNGETYVAWNWKANGAGVSNTDGTITSTVSVNTTSGFSIVTYTGTGANATVGHGIGVAPSMVIQKNRITTDEPWFVYHASLGATKFLRLNAADAEATNSSIWNNTAPTSTVVTLGNNPGINGSSQGCVLYCFSSVPGFSSMGSYVGNGSTDGPFVYTGFRPAFVMGKASSGTNASTSNWFIMDSARNSYNVANLRLFPNLSIADNTQDILDFTSNGFKIRTTNSSENTSGTTFIYMAFAENPFQYSLAR